MKITKHGLKIDRYLKFISNGYEFEVIPDYTSDTKHPDAVLVTMHSIKHTYEAYLNKGSFERHNFVIPIMDLKTSNPTWVHEHSAQLTKEYIRFSFTGRAWLAHHCSSGILEVEIIERSEDDGIHMGTEKD